jgi:hypothetical protein
MAGDPLQVLQKEWGVITGAPWSFMGAVVAIGTLIYVFINKLKAAELKGLEEQNHLKDVRMADQDRIIRDLKPTQTAYSKLSNATLKGRADRLVLTLRGFHQQESEREIREQEGEKLFRSQEWPSASLEAGRQTRKLRWTAAYNTDFKSEAMLLRDEIFTRLPGVPPVVIWTEWIPHRSFNVWQYRLPFSN